MCEGVGGPNPSGRAKGISLRDLRTLATVPGGGGCRHGCGMSRQRDGCQRGPRLLLLQHGVRVLSGLRAAPFLLGERPRPPPPVPRRSLPALPTPGSWQRSTVTGTAPRPLRRVGSRRKPANLLPAPKCHLAPGDAQRSLRARPGLRIEGPEVEEGIALGRDRQNTGHEKAPVSFRAFVALLYGLGVK